VVDPVVVELLAGSTHPSSGVAANPVGIVASPPPAPEDADEQAARPAPASAATSRSRLDKRGPAGSSPSVIPSSLTRRPTAGAAVRDGDLSSAQAQK
jgi:hypothetical protein